MPTKDTTKQLDSVTLRPVIHYQTTPWVSTAHVAADDSLHVCGGIAGGVFALLSFHDLARQHCDALWLGISAPNGRVSRRLLL